MLTAPMLIKLDTSNNRGKAWAAPPPVLGTLSACFQGWEHLIGMAPLLSVLSLPSCASLRRLLQTQAVGLEGELRG